MRALINKIRTNIQKTPHLILKLALFISLSPIYVSIRSLWNLYESDRKKFNFLSVICLTVILGVQLVGPLLPAGLNAIISAPAFLAHQIAPSILGVFIAPACMLFLFQLIKEARSAKKGASALSKVLSPHQGSPSLSSSIKTLFEAADQLIIKSPQDESAPSSISLETSTLQR